MRVFLVSIPKSGTYLVREILERLLGPSQLHISERGTYDYGAVPRQIGRRHPEQCLTRMPLTESLARVETFAVGHLPYRSDIAEALRDFKVLFVGRAYPDTVLSYMLYMLETGRCHRSPLDAGWVRTKDPREQFRRYIEVRGERIAATYRRIQLWRDKVPAFSYEQLMQNPIAVARRIARHVGGTISAAEVREALNADTQTRSHMDKAPYWSDEARQALEHCWQRSQPV